MPDLIEAPLSLHEGRAASASALQQPDATSTFASEDDTNLLRVGNGLPRLASNCVVKARPGFRWHCLRSKGFYQKIYNG